MFSPVKRQPKWLPTLPASYGELDDTCLVRHVRVPSGSTLLQLKSLILEAYDDQYSAAQITLFTRMGEEEAAPITTSRVAQRKLLMNDQEDPEATTLLIVSAMNEEESRLLVLPAVHSPSMATVLSHLAVGNRATACDGSVPERLAIYTPSLFDPLPLPSHVDDWHAQYREVPQPASEVRKVRAHTSPLTGRVTIYLQPIGCEVEGLKNKTCFDAELFDGLRSYLAAFFHGTDVTLRPLLTVHVKQTASTGCGLLHRARVR